MAILKQLTREEILKDYTHYGLMYGVIPVYIGDPNGESRICVRNWWPEWLLDFGDFVFDVSASCIQFFDPTYEPLFFYKITSEIKEKENANAPK
ncbi:MAG: hypothetical protein ACI846_000125 [Pseudoalteromonas distincta]|jgi:hypothetical protein